MPAEIRIQTNPMAVSQKALNMRNLSPLGMAAYSPASSMFFLMLNIGKTRVADSLGIRIDLKRGEP